MMKRSTRNRNVRRAALVMLASLTVAGIASSAPAASMWDNGAATLNWGDAANWFPDGVPAVNNQIQFNGVGVDSALVPAASTISMAGVALYTSSASTTEIDLNNGAGFSIDIGSSNNYTYWKTLKVQDANAYTLLSGAAGRLTINGTTTVDVVAGGSLAVDNGFTVAGFGNGTVVKTGDGALLLPSRHAANASTVNMNVQGGKISTDDLAKLGTGFLAMQTGGTFEYTGPGTTSKTGVLYWNSGSGTIDVTNAGGNAVFNITGGDLFSGGGTFTKSGAGTLTLATSGSSPYLGKAVALNEGTLALQANGANFVTFGSTVAGASGTQINVLAGTGTVGNASFTANWAANLADMDVAIGGKFGLRGNNITIDALTGGGELYHGYNSGLGAGVRTITLGVDDGSGTFTGVIHGNGASGTLETLENGVVALIKTGAGTQTFTNVHTFTGTTQVTGGGKLSVSDIGGIGQGTGGNWFAVQGGSTFEYTGAGAQTSTARDLYWNSGAATIDVTQAGANLTFNITGGTRNQAFTKAGAGQLTLSKSTAINEVTGSTWLITGGTLEFNQNHAGAINRFVGVVTGSAGALIKVSGTGYIGNDNLTANWGLNRAGLDIDTNASFDMRGQGITIDALTGSGAVADSYANGVNVLVIGANGGSGIFSGTIKQTAPTGYATTGSPLISITKTGAGTQVFSGPNSYTGTTTVLGGILSVNSLAAINGNASGYLAMQTGGTFQYTGAGSESRTGLLYVNSGSGGIDVTQAAANLAFNITGGDLFSGGGTFTKSGPGTLTLATAGVNFNIKALALNDGTLAMQANGANRAQFQGTVTGASGTMVKVLAGTGNVANAGFTADWAANLAGMDIAAGGKFGLYGDNLTIDALTGDGDLFHGYNSGGGAGTRTVTLGVDNGSGVFNGVIHGNGTSGTLETLENGVLALTKTGNGTQTLGGVNTYAGPTNINGGTLLITGSLAAASTVTVSPGGNLGGTGTVYGDVFVNAGGGLIPGASIGTLTLGGVLDIVNAVAAPATASMHFELAPAGVSDQVVLTGGLLSIGFGALELDDFDFLVLAEGVFTLFQTNQPISGSLGANVSGPIAPGWFATLEFADSNTDLVITVMAPAPAALPAGIAILALAAVRRRRRRRPHA